MSYIEKYVYDWVIARERALKSKPLYGGKKGEVFGCTDPEAWELLGKAEVDLHRYVKEWLDIT